MSAAAKALWHIETRFAGDLSLDAIAEASGVSRFHLARVFEARVGRTVMAYVRGRRLAVAAQRLADGAPDILSVALEAGYGSHEAFTRAFAAAFGMTPEQVRQRKSVSGLELQEAIRLTPPLNATASPHHVVTAPAMRLAGVSGHYASTETAAIPALWQQFVPYLGHIDAQTGDPYTTYGVCYNQKEDSVDYLCAVEVREGADLPAAFAAVGIKAGTYAVFPHSGHISGIRNTWNLIWDKWLPESRLKVLPEPFFEKYGPSFNGMTGEGGLEIWIPIAT